MLIDRLKILIRKSGYSSKVDFMIIGAQKAGTTSLFKILNQHSLLIGSTKKETHFFNNDVITAKNNLHVFHSFFPFPYHLPKGSQLFEATPDYLYHPKVAERLFKYNKKLKLIVLLRNPSHRALSAWKMYRYTLSNRNYNQSEVPHSFFEAVKNDLNNINSVNYYNNKIGFVNRGIYHSQVEKYLKFFDRNQMLFIEDKELQTDFDLVILKILYFLNVPQEKLTIEYQNISPSIVEDDYQNGIKLLVEFYKSKNELLYKLIGQRFDWD